MKLRVTKRGVAKTSEYNCSCRERKKVEMIFAHLKRILKLDRLDCGVQTVPMMSSRWQRLSKICEE
jgi:hypothetical protein